MQAVSICSLEQNGTASLHLRAFGSIETGKIGGSRVRNLESHSQSTTVGIGESSHSFQLLALIKATTLGTHIMRRLLQKTLPIVLLSALFGTPLVANTADDYVGLVTGSAKQKQAAWSRIQSSFTADQIPMMLDVLHVSPSQQLRQMAVELMRKATGQEIGVELDAWYEWLWNQEQRQDHPQLAEFKSKLWRHIDPKFASYFDAKRSADIRLDEVRWGGVGQDGIPPLRDPKLVTARQAKYLGERNVVFGVFINGEARAYPKRIVGWHEMVTETIGGLPIAAVYCTLCGTMVAFETKIGDTEHELGTSGFLYRSNKLMYDKATQSLWNTLWGVPVIGPLVGTVELPRHSVVTTTWGEWKRRHPDTMVLSIKTGEKRDYSEGAAYKAYFATDELMFTVPEPNDALPNKAEVLGLVLATADGPPGEESEALALSADYLSENPIHQDRLTGIELVIFTDSSGANRAYRAEGREFTAYDRADTAKDTDGVSWTLTEETLTSADGSIRLERVAGQRAFWFGWHAAFPRTRLVK